LEEFCQWLALPWPDLLKVLLATESAFSVSEFVLAAKEFLKFRRCGFLAAGAVGVLALDELLEFHERIG
jgi:hypothetical protein